MKHQAIRDLLERIITQDKTPDAGDFADVMEMATDAIKDFNKLDGVEPLEVDG